ncbi:GntR family transcriptional regulator [Vibrio comitans]|uniref:GntR family transcriptional regulator n=1 Tax=Vibrio comitans NBRC 102076 TaxID=1219078 RepID=A0A4Y3IP72_9VIBR|nr:GntR family transcriptional regulator [Vibrio comitans]GEA61166.1 GntR family transcriptional regulator [Vibrio comitans NBRC 102076]
MSDSGRRYVAIGKNIRNELQSSKYKVGDRLPTEREIGEQYGVSRTVIREAIIMLELEGLVEVRKGSGVYLMAKPDESSSTSAEGHDSLGFNVTEGDIGPFEMLQGRQLIESNIAEFAAINITKSEIFEMRKILNEERELVEAGAPSDEQDKQFHILIANATKNTLLIEISAAMWARRAESKMWAQLHTHIESSAYRLKWLEDHSAILMALQRKDSQAAKKAMWQHLENVKEALLRFSDIDDDNFDGYLFDSYPLSLPCN